MATIEKLSQVSEIQGLGRKTLKIQISAPATMLLKHKRLLGTRVTMLLKHKRLLDMHMLSVDSSLCVCMIEEKTDFVNLQSFPRRVTSEC